MSHRILVADDSSTIQKVIKIAFARFDADMIEAASFIEALAAATRAPLDLLVIDASLPGASGALDFAKLAQAARGAPVLLLVGTYETVDEAEFKRHGFGNFLRKPFESADLVARADALLGGGLAAAGATPQVSQRPTHSTVIQPPGSFPPFNPGDERVSTSSSQRPSSPSSPMPPVFERSLELGGLGDDEDDMAPARPVPPPPMTDQARKGRRAYGGEGGSSEPPPPPGRTVGGGIAIPPPPMTMRLEDDDPDVTGHRAAYVPHEGASPLPDIPPAQGLGEGRGLDLDLDLAGGTSGYAPKMAGSTPTSRGEGDDRIPTWVRQAVEEYCERHFKSLAREVIANELRRLADEKARHLVDN